MRYSQELFHLKKISASGGSKKFCLRCRTLIQIKNLGDIFLAKKKILKNVNPNISQKVEIFFLTKFSQNVY